MLTANVHLITGPGQGQSLIKDNEQLVGERDTVVIIVHPVKIDVGGNPFAGQAIDLARKTLPLVPARLEQILQETVSVCPFPLHEGQQQGLGCQDLLIQVYQPGTGCVEGGAEFLG
jgi:hypothetical protein